MLETFLSHSVANDGHNTTQLPQKNSIRRFQVAVMTCTEDNMWIFSTSVLQHEISGPYLPLWRRWRGAPIEQSTTALEEWIDIAAKRIRIMLERNNKVYRETH